MLEKTFEGPLDSKEIKPVNPRGNKYFWIFTGTTNAEAKASITWPPDTKSWVIGKGPGAGKDWGQEEKGTTEDEMVGWHHQLNGDGFGWTPGVGDGQGGLACWGSWGCKESDTNERLNWTELNLNDKFSNILREAGLKEDKFSGGEGHQNFMFESTLLRCVLDIQMGISNIKLFISLWNYERYPGSRYRLERWCVCVCVCLCNI